MPDAAEPLPSSDVPVDAAAPSLPEELPPVEPPSAGFIIQLFVVPGLIVLAVVGVWALFGKLAAGEQDWQSLIVELEHSNEHRRWRGAHGLAQMLQTDRERETGGPQLTQNPVIVGKLTDLFASELAKSAPTDKDKKFQEFLARTMGLLESNEKTIPILREAMRPEHDLEIRKNSVAAVAVIAGRAREQGQPLSDAALTASLIDVSADSEPLMRQVAAFTLGLVAADEGRKRLVVLLDDADVNTQLNAAIGLSRAGSTAGLSVFNSMLTDSTQPAELSQLPDENSSDRQQQNKRQVEINNRRYQRDLRLLNTLQALERIAGNLSTGERSEVIGRLKDVIDSDEVAKRFRERAELVLKTLGKTN